MLDQAMRANARLKEENELFETQIDKLKVQLQKDPGAAEERLKKELEETRQLLRCSACSKRFKTHVITRCMHVFWYFRLYPERCVYCVETNLMPFF
jgi:hypothetical protein